MLLPVADRLITVGLFAEQNDCDEVPVGADGIGCAFIVALLETSDEQAPTLTVNVYDPATNPVKLAVVPVPVIVEPPVAVTVHVPLAGNPLKATAPVEVAQVGCVMLPTVGAEGRTTVSVAVDDGKD
jgi:hypothetical protein